MTEDEYQIVYDCVDYAGGELNNFWNKVDQSSVVARMVCYGVFRKLGYTTTEIAQMMGRRHEAVDNSINRLDETPKLQKIVNLFALKYRDLKKNRKIIRASSSQWKVINAAIKATGTNIDDFPARNNTESVNARLICYRVFRLLGFSYPQIGKILNKNHTTILSGNRKIDKNLDLVCIAIGIYEKIKGEQAKDISQYLSESHLKLMKDRDAIAKKIKEEKEISEICKDLSMEEIYVKEQIDYLIKVGKIKKIPDYHKNIIKLIYL